MMDTSWIADYLQCSNALVSYGSCYFEFALDLLLSVVFEALSPQGMDYDSEGAHTGVLPAAAAALWSRLLDTTAPPSPAAAASPTDSSQLPPRGTPDPVAEVPSVAAGSLCGGCHRTHNEPACTSGPRPCTSW